MGYTVADILEEKELGGVLVVLGLSIFAFYRGERVNMAIGRGFLILGAIWYRWQSRQ